MTTIGRGALVLRADRDPVSADRILTLVVTDAGIDVHDLAAGPEARPLAELVPELVDAGPVGSGHLALGSLPATPSDAFDGITVDVTGDGVRLRIGHAAEFGPEVGPTFSGLDLTVTDPTDGPLAVDGSVLLHLGAGQLNLAAALDRQGRLRFGIDQDQEVPLPGRASLTLTELDVGVDTAEPWDGLLALYTFDEEPDPEADVVFHDSALVVDADGKLDPVDVVGTVSRPGQDRTRGVATGGGGGLRSPEVAGKLTAMGGDDGAHRTDAITVEAWIVNRAAPPTGRKPARIVSLSHSHDERNLTLGLDKQPSNGHTLYEGRLRTTSSVDGTPGILSTRPQALGRPTMVALARGRTTPTDEVAGHIFVDGLDATEPVGSGDRRGAFTNWTPYHLMLGNEDGADRAWDGELHRVAIYNRELSADEIRDRYQARVTHTGTLAFDGLPAPLDREFPVSILPAGDGSGRLGTAIDPSVGPLQVAPGLTVDQLVLWWPGQDEQAAGEAVTGTAVLTLWGQVFEAEVGLNTRGLVLTTTDPGLREIDLDRGRGTEHFGHLRLRGLTMRAYRGTQAAPDPTWTIVADGDLRVHGFAPPLDQTFPLEVFLHDGNVWAGARPAADALPLPFFDHVTLTSVDLRYRPVRGSGWMVEPDVDRPDRSGLVLSLFRRSLALQPSFVEDGPAIALRWQRNAAAGAGTADPVGVAVPAELQLVSNPGWEARGPFWTIDLLATLALGPGSGAAPDVERLDLSLANGQLERDPGPRPNRLTASGDGRLAHGDTGLLAGAWRSSDGRGFRIDGGRFQLFPHWSTVLAEAEAILEIGADGRVRSHPAAASGRGAAPSPVEGYTAPGYPLTEPTLVLDEGRLTLRGRWAGLAEPQAFHATERDAHLYLAATDEVELPFEVDLPALVDEATGAPLRPAGPLASRMTMAIRTELQRTGYLAEIDGSFPVPAGDDGGDVAIGAAADEPVRLPSLRIYDSPATPNVILGRLVERLADHSGQLLAGQVANAEDYHVAAGPTDMRLLAWSGAEAITTELPPLFASDVAIGDDASPIRLVQTGATCTLTVANAPTAAADAITGAVDDLHTAIAGLPSEQAPLSGGALSLLRRRLAERLPLEFGQLLAAHYGWDPGRGVVDLEPGMRLRIDPQPYHFVPPSVGEASSGRVASGTIHVPVTGYVHRAADGSRHDLVGFGPFLSRLERDGQPNLAADGVGAPIGITGPAYRRAHLRLIHPRDPSSGSGPERLAVVIGADTPAELDAATADFLTDGDLDGRNGSGFYFRGRAGVTPEIQVHLDGRPVWVPLGTTLRQLIGSTDDVPTSRVSGPDPGRFVRSRPLRLVHDGPDSTPRYRFINLSPDPVRVVTTGDGAIDALDLPLIKGDRVRS